MNLRHLGVQLWKVTSQFSSPAVPSFSPMVTCHQPLRSPFLAGECLAPRLSTAAPLCPVSSLDPSHCLSPPPWPYAVPLGVLPGLPPRSASLSSTRLSRSKIQAISVFPPPGLGQNIGPKFLVTCGRDTWIHSYWSRDMLLFKCDKVSSTLAQRALEGIETGVPEVHPLSYLFIRTESSRDPGNKTYFELVVTRFELNLIISSEIISDKCIVQWNHNTKSGQIYRKCCWEVIFELEWVCNHFSIPVERLVPLITSQKSQSKQSCSDLL